MDRNSKQDSYPIKEFINYFKKSQPFNSFISEFRNILINSIFTNRVYHSVLTRMEFYYNGTKPFPPSESCNSHLTRILFTDEPPPYHYDFKLSSPSPSSFDEMILILRRFYGYSFRRSSKKGSSAKSFLHSKNSINKSVHKSIFSPPPTQHSNININLGDTDVKREVSGSYTDFKKLKSNKVIPVINNNTTTV